MKNIVCEKKDSLKLNAIDIILTLFAIFSPIYSAFKGGLGLKMFGQLEYLYFGISAILLFFFLRDVFSANSQAKKVGKVKFTGKYTLNVLENRWVYSAMFVICFVFLIVIRPKMGALCVLLSSLSIYFVHSVRFVLSMNAPTIGEHGIYFFGTFYDWQNIRSFNVREKTSQVKFNVKETARKRLFTGDVVMIIEEPEKVQNILENRIKPIK